MRREFVDFIRSNEIEVFDIMKVNEGLGGYENAKREKDKNAGYFKT
jgi:hypothetical protein